MMSNAYRRKKSPEAVKQALIQSAIELICSGGLQSLSLQAVADHAGVTKGGLFHHFETKIVLLEVVCRFLLDEFASRVEQYIERNPKCSGCYTRAYIRAIMDLDADADMPGKNALWLLILNDERSRQIWNDWFASMNAKYAASDALPEHTLLRMAADGIWLSALCQTEVPNRDAVVQALWQKSNGV